MPDGRTSPVDVVKRAALEAMEASKPVNVLFGTVVSASPLQISVEQKMTLGMKQLILTRNVTDYTVSMTITHETESALTTHTHDYSGNVDSGGPGPHSHGYTGTTDPTDLAHIHEYKGTKAFLVHHALKAGERVVLVRLQGGKKFLVLDRLGA